jgi:hypothetical protein
MTSSTQSLYAGHRFPPELISYTVWLNFRFPLSLRMVEEILAFRGIEVSHETIRQWGLKFGQEFANLIRRLPRPGDKWRMDEVVLKISRQEALSVARCGSARRRSRCSGSEPARQEGGQAAAAQAAEAAMAGPSGHDHGRAGLI